MIEVPTALLVAQWVVLLGLGTLVVLTYRQLAYLLGLSRGVSGSGGLAIGERVPTFEYMARNGEGEERYVFAADGARTVLMFTSPGCASCATALTNLEKVTRKLRQNGLRVLAVTEAEPEVIDAVEAFRDSPIPIARVDAEVPTQVFRTYTTPFVYAIGASGEVVGAREAVTPGQIRELVKKL
jgi:hypothetical protein